MIDVGPGRPGCAEVTFEHPSPTGDLSVAGDFNQWTPWRLVSDPERPDVQRLTTEIPIGRRYRFRYVRDGGAWENDWHADDYTNNERGGEDSVLDLRHDGPHRRRLGIADPRDMVRDETQR